jgi:hypothetical protein
VILNLEECSTHVSYTLKGLPKLGIARDWDRNPSEQRAPLKNTPRSVELQQRADLMHDWNRQEVQS